MVWACCRLRFKVSLSDPAGWRKQGEEEPRYEDKTSGSGAEEGHTEQEQSGLFRILSKAGCNPPLVRGKE